MYMLHKLDNISMAPVTTGNSIDFYYCCYLQFGDSV